MWMPAQIVYSISFRWRNGYGSSANWSPNCIGLKLRNAITGGTQRWSSGASFSHEYDAIDKIYRVYNRNEFNDLRVLSPEWYVYGLLFNFRSPSTSYLANNHSYLTDCRIGWKTNTTIGTNRMICPREINWNDFSALNQQGLRYYQ